MSDERAVVPVSGPSDEEQQDQKAQELARQQVNTAVALAIGEKGVQYATVKEAVAYAEACWRSGLLPEQVKNGRQAFAIMAAGAEVGLKPFASWSGIYLTKANRLAMLTKTGLAVVRRSGLLEDYDERIEHEGSDEMQAVCIAQRKGQKTAIIKTFSVADARAAGLLERKKNRHGEEYDSTYDKYLKDMLLSRARGRCLDIGFSDALAGILPEGIAEDADRVEAEATGVPVEKKAAAALAATTVEDPLAEQLRKPASAPELVPIDASKPMVLSTAPTQEQIDASVDEALPPAETATPKKCPRCGTRLNELGGCEVCGFPGSTDLR